MLGEDLRVYGSVHQLDDLEADTPGPDQTEVEAFAKGQQTTLSDVDDDLDD